jgi:hypothetical protein
MEDKEERNLNLDALLVLMIIWGKNYARSSVQTTYHEQHLLRSQG